MKDAWARHEPNGRDADRRGIYGDGAGLMPGRSDSLRPRRLAVCRWLLQVHRLQISIFGARLAADACKALSPSAYQEILLELYLAGIEDRRVYQSSLAPTQPPATVHRQAARLEVLGAVSRSVDGHDHRRLNLTLTPQMRSVLDMFMDAADLEFHLGPGLSD